MYANTIQSNVNPAQKKMNRLEQEIHDLINGLPVEATNSIFIRYD